MTTPLVIDEKGLTDRPNNAEFQPQSAVLRGVARFISYLFHPLFIPVYVAWFLIQVQPFFFPPDPGRKLMVMVQFFVGYSFFPLVTILMAKALGFLDSIYLKTQKERIIPYIACNIYYFWVCYVLRNQPEFSKEVIQFSMAVFIASSLGLLANIYMKISMHAMSVGVVIVFVALLSLTQAANYTLYLPLTLFIGGLVCTARLIVSDHTQPEIYGGLLIGGASQLLAVWADGILP